MIEKMWTEYHVIWDFITKLCGSVPGDPDLIEPWLKARMPRKAPANATPIADIVEEVKETIQPIDDAEEPEEEPINRLVFQQAGGRPDDRACLVVRAGTIKSHMKDCSRQLYWHHPAFSKRENQKVFYNRVANGIFMASDTYWVPILKNVPTDAVHAPDGYEPVVEPEGPWQKPIHVQTRQGPRSTIKVVDYVMGARFDFRITVLGGCVTEDDLRKLFDYGGRHGYGGERGDGEGRYKLTLLELVH